ncbi:MAG: hypothetical protein Edafosvirus17_15 [Edafosvirus sp.]|uniref:Uncharacterized protein n=1 Tax=Edafosvirus sp. TaxID=2487765 RepID=A0A3G4ZYQ2_9VIRU|nr:MAG: hypothetical protein Edafosvirus17_15 [Edafosvirus sp.]
MRILILLGILCTANSLDLAPINISPITNYDFQFDVPLMTNDQNVIINLMKQANNQFCNNIGSHLSNIAGEILLSANLENTDLMHLTWNFNIGPATGSLNVVAINANINKNHIHITAGMITMVQPIPAVYDLKETCTNTGSRRYGFCGPRSRECRYHHVQRGLHGHEIQEIQNKLLSHIPHVQKLLTQ